jgi:hypothetical protein
MQSGRKSSRPHARKARARPHTRSKRCVDADVRQQRSRRSETCQAGNRTTKSKKPARSRAPRSICAGLFERAPAKRTLSLARASVERRSARSQGRLFELPHVPPRNVHGSLRPFKFRPKLEHGSTGLGTFRSVFLEVARTGGANQGQKSAFGTKFEDAAWGDRELDRRGAAAFAPCDASALPHLRGSSELRALDLRRPPPGTTQFCAPARAPLSPSATGCTASRRGSGSGARLRRSRSSRPRSTPRAWRGLSACRL